MIRNRKKEKAKNPYKRIPEGAEYLKRGETFSACTCSVLGLLGLPELPSIFLLLVIFQSSIAAMNNVDSVSKYIIALIGDSVSTSYFVQLLHDDHGRSFLPPVALRPRSTSYG